MGVSGARPMNLVPKSVSLPDRLKLARPDVSDWHRVPEIYLPLSPRWLARIAGLGDEANDLAQAVFLAVVRGLPRFERRREGSFRAWLQRVTVNRTGAIGVFVGGGRPSGSTRPPGSPTGWRPPMATWPASGTAGPR